MTSPGSPQGLPGFSNRKQREQNARRVIGGTSIVIPANAGIQLPCCSRA